MAGTKTEIDINVDSTIKGLNDIEKGASKASGSVNELSKSFSKLGKSSVDMSSAKALEVIKQRIEKLVPEYNEFLKLKDKIYPIIDVQEDEVFQTKKKNYSRQENRQGKKISKSVEDIQALWGNLDKKDRGELFSWGQKNLYNPEKNPSGKMKANPFEWLDIDPNILIKGFIGKFDPDAMYRQIFNKYNNVGNRLLSKEEAHAEYEADQAKYRSEFDEEDFETLDASLVELSESAKTVVNSFNELTKTGSSNEKTISESTLREIKQETENKHTYDAQGALEALLKNNSNPEYDWVYDYVKEGPKETKQEEIISEIKEIHSALTNPPVSESSREGKETNRRINGQVFKPSDLDDPILGKALKQALSGNNPYGRNVRVAEGNLQMARNEESLKIAKMALAIQNKSLGGGNGNGYVKNMGEALAAQLGKAFNNGFKNINFGKLIEDTYIQRAKSKKQDKAFDKYALENDQLFATDTLYDKDEFKDILEKTEAFKAFAEQLRADLDQTAEELPDDEIYNQLKSGKQSRQSIIEGLTDKDRKSLRGYVKGLTKDKDGRKDLLKSLKGNAKDRVSLLGGIASGGGKGAASLANIAGKVAGPVALIQGLGAATKAVLKFADGTIQAYEGIQKLQTQLGVVFATTSQANSTFNEIAEYAKKSPFGVEQTTQEAILLKQSGVYSSELMDTIKRIGDLSSGSAEKMKSISEVYARVMSSTTVTARDMRQLANAGVASYSALSKATGTDKSLIRAQLQSGKVTSQDFKAMVKALTDEGGMFYGATERGAKTIAARKQNLSDAKQLATSEIGRFFATMGGQTTQDSLYGKGISLLENIYGSVYDIAKKMNDQKEAESIEVYTSRLQGLWEKRDKYESKGKDTSKIDKDIAELEQIIRGQQGAASAAGATVWETAKKEIQEALDKNNLNVDWLKETFPTKEKFQSFKEGYIPDTGEAAMMGGVTALLQDNNFLKNIEYYLDHSIDELFKKAAEAGQKGADMLDAAINEIDTALDDVENTQNRLQDLSAAQTRMSSARRDWNQNSPVAQMMLKDAQAQRDDYLKQRISYYEDKTLDKETGKFDLSKLGIEEFAEAAKMITTEVRKLDLDMENGHIWDQSANRGQGAVTEEGVETFAILKENLEEVYKTLINDGGEDLVEESGIKDFESLISMLGQDVSKFDKDKLETLMKLLDKVNESSEKAAETKGEKGEKYREILQAAQTETVRDTSNAKYLNKRKQAVLWAQILSQTTGLSAERVQGVGAATAMKSYTTNFAQREMFSSLGKALMSNGSSLKDLSNILKQNHTGVDNYGHDLYNWEGATAQAEQLAAKQSLETQGALIDAYKQQIDVLTNLEMSGIATRDQWDNLGSLAAQLGTGFSLAAEEMADGTYKFTEATIQAAEDMKKQLNAKKFVQELNYILRSAREKVDENVLSSRLTSQALLGNLNIGGLLNTDQIQQIATTLVELVKKGVTISPDVWKTLGVKEVNIDSKAVDKLEEVVSILNENSKNNFNVNVKEAASTTATVTKILSKDFLNSLGINDFKLQTYDLASAQKNGIRSKDRKKWEKEVSDYRTSQLHGQNTASIKDQGIVDLIIKNAQEDAKRKLQAQGFRDIKINSLTGQITATREETTYSQSELGLTKTDANGAVSNLTLQNLTEEIEELQKKVKKGTATDEEIIQFYKLILSLGPDLVTNLTDLNVSIKNDTVETNRLNKLLEANRGLDVLKEYREMSGYQGELRKAAYEERDYASMPEYAPLRNSINSEAKERALALMGYPEDANWKDVMKRLSYNYVSKDTRETLMANGFGGLDEAQKSSLLGAQDYLGKFLYNNLDDLVSDKEKRKELKLKLGDTGEGGFGYENLETFANALKDLGTEGIDNLTEAWARETAATIDASTAIEDCGRNLRNALKDSGMNAYLNTTKLIGENWYKINNELMTQEDAVDSIKKSLAGQAASLMETISKEAVVAGLRLIGAGAMDGMNWGVIAAGMGLCAVGGFAGIASGLLSGYANDNSEDKTEEKINRLEALKNNLADLLKQAKADAEYYEVNLKAKQAFSTNEGVSAMKVRKTNDMILSPNGTFSTHPDDYIMAMKDPASLMGNGSPIINFSIINTSGANLNVERSKTTQEGNNIDIEVVVNGIVQKGMVSGDYDDAFTAMQARNEGIKTSA